MGSLATDLDHQPLPPKILEEAIKSPSLRDEAQRANATGWKDW